MGRLFEPGRQFEDDDGNPLAGGSVYFYENGTTTDKTTYSDASLTTANANPLTLDSDGRLPNEVFGSGVYTVRVEDSGGALIWTADDIASHDAEGITYNQGGASATDRTLEARLQDRVSVKDFGATGDGSTDDRASINSAIAAVSASGGTVFFPPGTYIIGRGGDATGVNLKSNVRLLGSGVGATILKGEASAGNLHLVTNDTFGLSNIEIAHMTLDHNGVNLGATAGVHTLRLAECSKVWLHHLEVKNSDHHGILGITNSQDTASVNTDWFISDIYLENIGVSGRQGGDGLRIFLGSARAVINNIVGNGIEYHGIHAGLNECTISNVILKNVGNAALSIQSDGAQISNVHIEWDAVTADLAANRPAAGTAGRHFYATDTTAWSYDNGSAWQTAASNPNAIWCITRSGFPAGGRIQLSNIKAIFSVTENQTYDPATSDGIRTEVSDVVGHNLYVEGLFRHGFFIESGADDCKFSALHVKGVRQDGIRINGDRCNISGWTVETAATGSGISYGVRISGADGTHVVNGTQLDSVNVPTAIKEESAANNSIIRDNNLVASGTAVEVIGAGTIVSNNIGYVTEAKGSSSIPSGSTSVAVTHGLSYTPSAGEISVIFTEDPTTSADTMWVSTITSTQFTVNVETDPGASNLDFAWAVRRI